MFDFREISSKENELIKQISKLQTSASYRKETGLFVAEGLRICNDCKDNFIKFKHLVFTKDFYCKFPNEVEGLSNFCDDNILVTDNVFNKISDTKSPQGILAVGEIPVSACSGISKNGKYIALENISDPSNLGAVSRTAEALGIDGIILSDNGCDPFSPKSIRASMGTLLRMPIYVLKDFVNEIAYLGLTTYACVVRNGEPVENIKFDKGSIVVIGNEANGLTDRMIEKSDKSITIKMSGRAESLNASVAAAIVMWELTKQ